MMEQKKNRVYYGEYSLRHWIHLMLSGNIVLPQYQRSFVWSEEKMKRLMETLAEDGFVPPVTIAAFGDSNAVKNLILDGQQRLTSLLLTYLGYFPNKERYKQIQEEKEKFLDANDDKHEDDETEERIDWTFEELVKIGSSKEDIRREIESSGKDDDPTKAANDLDRLYKKLNFEKNYADEDFLKEHYLGFCYLVPNEEKEETDIKKYFSSIFRNINILGSSLSFQESRKSLYYLQDGLDEFFSPIFLRGSKVDFVRYLAILSNYNKLSKLSNYNKMEKINEIAKGYSRKMENFYEDYIFSTIWGDIQNQSAKFSKIDEVFASEDDRKRRLSILEDVLDKMDLNKKGLNEREKEKPLSIIDLDLYLIGIIHHVLFENKEIDTAQKEQITEKIEEKINEIKEDYNHIKTPSALKHLRNRIDSSINIYEGYLKNE